VVFKVQNKKEQYKAMIEKIIGSEDIYLSPFVKESLKDALINLIIDILKVESGDNNKLEPNHGEFIIKLPHYPRKEHPRLRFTYRVPYNLN